MLPVHFLLDRCAKGPPAQNLETWVVDNCGLRRKWWCCGFNSGKFPYWISDFRTPSSTFRLCPKCVFYLGFFIFFLFTANPPKLRNWVGILWAWGPIFQADLPTTWNARWSVILRELKHSHEAISNCCSFFFDGLTGYSSGTEAPPRLQEDVSFLRGTM